jgi:hypothetical protein
LRQKAQPCNAKGANTFIEGRKKIMTVARMKKKNSTSSRAANQNYLDEMKPDSVDEVIDRYKRTLVEKESAQLDHDRDVLLTMYDRLLTRKARRAQKVFYEKATSDEIADRILELTEEEIEQDRGN